MLGCSGPEDRKVKTGPNPESFIEISLQGTTVNQESRGRSHFLSYVTNCSHIGNKKLLKINKYA